MSEIDRVEVEKILSEIEGLLAMRQGFVDAYREWRTTAADRVAAACGETHRAGFEAQAKYEIPINRQHRVHVYRQILSGQSRYLSRLLEEANE